MTDNVIDAKNIFNQKREEVARESRLKEGARRIMEIRAEKNARKEAEAVADALKTLENVRELTTGVIFALCKSLARKQAGLSAKSELSTQEHNKISELFERNCAAVAAHLLKSGDPKERSIAAEVLSSYRFS